MPVGTVATCEHQGDTNEEKVECCGEPQRLRKQELHCGHGAEVLDEEISASSKIISL